MRRSVEDPAELTDTALLQDGVVSRRQLRGWGLSDGVIDNRIRGGRWRRVAGGVYHPTSGPIEWRARARAGVLIGGPDAMLRGRSAAFVHGLVKRPPRVIEVLVPATVHRVAAGYAFTRSATRSSSVGSLPVTRVEPTIVDLSGSADLLDLLLAVFRQRLTTRDRLLAEIRSRRRVTGRKKLLALLADDLEGLESVLEYRYANDVVSPHGLPRGVRQVRSNGTRIDVMIDGWLVIELDGDESHGSEVARQRDRLRDNGNATRGRTTLRFTWWDVVLRPCWVANQIEATLRAHGWNGPPAHCRHC